MKIAVFLVEGFEPIEAIETIDILRRCKLDVKTIALGDELIVKGAHGITLVCDETFTKVNYKNFDAIVAPGGPGVDNYFTHNDFLELIKSFYHNGKLLAFICAAPKVLGAVGVLANKEFTSFPTVKETIEKDGGIYKDKSVVENCNVITAKAAGCTKEFAVAIASYFLDENEVEMVIKNMYY